MHVISSLLFSISANIDNFTVAIAYGIKKIRIGILSNLLIALVSGIGTFLSMFIGLFI
ncbi:sporulation membrane protein YtaF, partial [Thermoanaerobacterium sp. PSU-2]